MSNRWQMQGSYVWSQLDGDTGITRLARRPERYDYTNPNNLSFVGQGRGAIDQPHAFKLLGSYQAPWGITIGANYQALSGLPVDRMLSVAFSQGTRGIPVEPRGTYRADNAEPAVAAGGQELPLQRPARRRSSWSSTTR